MPAPSGCVIGTYRTDELNRRHPLRPWLAEMERLPPRPASSCPAVRSAELDAQIAAILDHRPGGARCDRAPDRGQPVLRRGAAGFGRGRPGDGLPQTLRDVLLTRVTASVRGGAAAARGRRGGRPDGGFGPARHGRRGRRGRAGGSAPRRPRRPDPRDRSAAAGGLSISPRPARRGRLRRPPAVRAPRLHAATRAALEARPTPEGARAQTISRRSPTMPPLPTSRSGRCGRGCAPREPPRCRAASPIVPCLRTGDRPVGRRAGGRSPGGRRPGGACTTRPRWRRWSPAPWPAVDFAMATPNSWTATREPERWAARQCPACTGAWVSGAMNEGLAILQSTAARLEQARGVADAGAGPRRARRGAHAPGDHSGRRRRRAAIELARAAGARGSRGTRPQHARRQHRPDRRSPKGCR